MDKSTPVILSNNVEASNPLEPIYDSSKSFYNKANVEQDIYGGLVLKSYDVPIMAIYKGMPFAVENNYEAGRNGVRLLDREPDVGGFSQTTTRHTKEFLSQYTSLGKNLSTQDWNKVLAQRTNERAMDVYGFTKTDQGYEFAVAIDDQYGERLAVSVAQELVSLSTVAISELFSKVMEMMHQHDNPYNRALADMYEQNRDFVMSDFIKDYETYMEQAMENNPEIKSLVYENAQAPEPPMSDKLRSKIDQEMNRSDTKDVSNDMDI